MSLEKKKIMLSIQKAMTAKLELEVKIAEREADIERMSDHIELQDKRIDELNEELKNLK